MKRFRCTRPEVYGPGTPGHTDPSAREGHYFDAPSAREAREKMRADFPGERFDIVDETLAASSRHYLRACRAELERIGVERNEVLTFNGYLHKSDRWKAMLCDVYLLAFESLIRGRLREALRAALMIPRYVDSLQGWPGMAVMHDGFIELQNQLEDAIEPF